MADRKRHHVYGPYPHRSRWRVELITDDGRRSRLSFATEREAAAVADAARARLDGFQVSDAVREYLEHEQRRGLKAGTVATKGYRLRAVLGVDEARGRTGGPVVDLTPARAARLLEGLEASVDTKIGTLSACRAFGSYLVERRLLRADPFAGCKVVGRKRRGKVQLTIDEGRAFFATALELAEAGDVAALAVLLTLALGCRASEITDRRVRDLDDRGTVLVIPVGKTENAARRLLVPDALRPLLARAVLGRGMVEPLLPREGLPPTRSWLAYHVTRICRAARVTEVCPHSLRGLAATAATRAQESAEAVASFLGHGNTAVAERHYLAPGTRAEVARGRALTVLAGGLT